ncbi:MAG: hypothetical protein LH614_12375 [Pyrinomonadaceae bacterium]|nr:hypothetical protein [Pyrinomonadaceae bacterium]
MQETNIVKIKPGGSRLNLELKDLWTYCKLLYFLTLRDIDVSVTDILSVKHSVGKMAYFTRF